MRTFPIFLSRLSHGQGRALGPRRRVAALGVAALVGALAQVASPVAAVAATAAPPPLPETVSADALPTVQIDGVVWKQVVVGDTVYVAGSFANARPAGSAPGTNLVPRANMLAYDVRTGVLVPGFSPMFNDQVKDLAVSPDGTRLYAVGPFTTVNGLTRNRVAVFDLPSGNLSAFAPNVNSVVQSVAATNSTLFLGGYFGVVNNVYRPRLAAIDARTGTVSDFNPSVDDRQVQAIVVAPDEKSIVIGGNFTSVNGSSSPGYGLARLSVPDGAPLPLPLNTEVRNAGDQAGITSLSSDGTNFYGSGWVYGKGGNMEGSFSANWSDGSLKWIEDCHGDTYGVFPVGDVVYSASHKHYCGNSGGFPQTTPWSYHHSTAWTKDVRGTNTRDIYGYPDHPGTPRPQLLNWFPQTDVGTYTGQSQATWTVSGNAQYVVYGGEFPKVNGTPQQGLVRYAVRSIAPKKQGPRLQTIYWNPGVRSVTRGTVRISFSTNWDRDDSALTYRVYRGSETSTPLSTEVIDTPFWSPQARTVTDTGLAPGSTQRYRVTATDRDGNVGRSDWITVTVSDALPDDYLQSVLNDGARNLWRLDEPSGATAADTAGTDDLTLNGGYTRGVTGALASNTATSFNGVDAFGATATAIPGPNTFSVEAWFRTTSKTGGKIISFGDRKTGNSSNYDRHVYMDAQGKVWFGVWNSAAYTVNTPKALNDGQWHHVVGTMGAGGVTLFVDGLKVGTNSGTSVAQAYSGYWRVGGDSAWNGNNYFKGQIDEPAVYPTVLSYDQVQAHYVASGRALAVQPRPTDSYGAAVYNANPSIFWRLDEASGSAAVDTSRESNDGQYVGGRTPGVAGAVPSGTAVSFDGVSGGVGASRSWDNPTQYSLQTWFRTTTTRGGKLIGFGSASTGPSASYDRHVYMFDDGRLRFGTWTGQENDADTTTAYNDGRWHQMVATQGPDGMKLYVDSVLVATNPQTSAQAYVGYWRVGGDAVWGGSSSSYFAGTLDEVAVYDRPLSSAEVSSMFTAGGGTVPNAVPNAALTVTADGLDIAADGSASSDPDGSISDWSWTFGDGGTATGPKPVHRYVTPGPYTVTLTVTDNQGATRSASQDVTVVNRPPTAAFTATANDLSVVLDASASSDSDGTLADYAWDLGDGRTASGRQIEVTYPTSGTRTIRLTVTDSGGGTASAEKSVTVTAPNALPAASFTASTAGATVGVDGTGSSDPDGTVVGYAWDFGDGAQATGATATHTYAATGSYTVTLVVTDDRGGTASATRSVQAVVPNRAPTALMVSTTNGLTASFDASGSSDPDGDTLAYAWDFGDGQTSSLVAPAHAYDAAGTYLVTLVVSDGRGGTDTVTRSVTVDVPLFAKDSFERSVTGGWGTADVGGPWSAWSTASRYSVAGGQGRMNLSTAGANGKVLLNAVSRTDLELRTSFTVDAIANGGGTTVSLAARSNGYSSAYLGKVWIKANGTVGVSASALQTSETTLAQVNVAGLTAAAGEALNVRMQTTGSSPTTIRLRVWKAGTTEPTVWQITTTSALADLQDAGGVGLFAAVSGSATNTPVMVRFDDVWVGPVG